MSKSQPVTVIIHKTLMNAIKSTLTSGICLIEPSRAEDIYKHASNILASRMRIKSTTKSSSKQSKASKTTVSFVKPQENPEYLKVAKDRDIYEDYARDSKILITKNRYSGAKIKVRKSDLMFIETTTTN